MAKSAIFTKRVTAEQAHALFSFTAGISVTEIGRSIYILGTVYDHLNEASRLGVAHNLNLMPQYIQDAIAHAITICSQQKGLLRDDDAKFLKEHLGKAKKGTAPNEMYENPQFHKFLETVNRAINATSENPFLDMPGVSVIASNLRSNKKLSDSLEKRKKGFVKGILYRAELGKIDESKYPELLGRLEVLQAMGSLTPDSKKRVFDNLIEISWKDSSGGVAKENWNRIKSSCRHEKLPYSKILNAQKRSVDNPAQMLTCLVKAASNIQTGTVDIRKPSLESKDSKNSPHVSVGSTSTGTPHMQDRRSALGMFTTSQEQGLMGVMLEELGRKSSDENKRGNSQPETSLAGKHASFIRLEESKRSSTFERTSSNRIPSF